MKEIRTIIWDLDETVWFHLNDQGKIVASLLGIEDKETFAKQYSEMWKYFNLYFENKIATYEAVRQYMEEKLPILKRCNLSGNDFLQILKEKKKKLEVVNPEAIEVIRYLKEKGYNNISITDWFASDQEKVLKDLQVFSYIDKVYGCDDGYMKNNYHKTLQITKQLQLEKRREEFVMIGDSPLCDVCFANSLGIKSIWYNRKGMQNTTSHIPTLEVSSLLKLKSIF